MWFKSTTPTKPKKTTLHPFHIVDPSPWPLVTAFSMFFTSVGLVLKSHSFKLGNTLFFLGFFSTLANVTFWWRDVIREATFEGQHTTAVQNGIRFGSILFILSEVSFFFAFFWAYFHSSLNPTPSIGAVWPPKGIITSDPWLIPLLNTSLLLTSGSFLTWSHTALLIGYRLEACSGLLATIVLAVLFTSFQLFEYINAPFTIADGIYGTTFYSLTGLHGSHVLVGTVFLLVTLYRSVRHHFTVSVHVGFECAAWYWHFVDVVWIILFLAVYVWGN